MIDTKKKYQNISEVRVLFSGTIIFIEKEELAYPFITLLADFGGVLGLFIGFNFLMIWDIIVSVIEKIKAQSIYSKGSPFSEGGGILYARRPYHNSGN